MSLPLRVLLIEDSENDAILLIRELQRGGYEPYHQRVETAAALAAALEEDWDIIIADYILPHFGGLEALRLVRDRRLDLPFIIVSGKIGEETAVKAMRSGAHDYLMKSNLGRLVPAVHRELKEAAVRREHKQAAEALRKSEERYRRLVETMNEGLAVEDENGRFTYVNDRLCAIWGCSRDELIGRPVSDFFDEQNRRIIEEQSFQRRRGAPGSYDLVLCRNDGRLIHTIVSTTPVFDNEGKYQGNFAVITDITARKQAEDLLRRTTAQLEIEREALEKKNIALREILDQIDAEKDILKRQIATNLEQAITPTLLRLKETSHKSQARIFEMLEKELQEITSPFLSTIKDNYAMLSPRELEVCRMIKNGLTSKEIAEALNLSLLTIHKYRELIRKKLGLVNNSTNLHTYLQSL